VWRERGLRRKCAAARGFSNARALRERRHGSCCVCSPEVITMAKMEKPEALAMLTEDHEHVKALLEKLKKSGDKAVAKRAQLIEEIRTELTAHMALEEEIFYPAFRQALGNKEGDKIFHEALEEHHAAEVVLRDALDADPKSPSFSGKVKVLAELVEHHADEEEKEMFAKARKAMPLEQRRELAQQMLSLKRELATAA
jgi:hypothetical protein